MIISESELEQNYPQIYVTTEDGVYFNISFSEGSSAYKIIELDENDIKKMIRDINNQVELYKLYFHGSKVNE